MGVYAAPFLLADDVTKTVDPGIFLRYRSQYRQNQPRRSAGFSNAAANGTDLLAAGHYPSVRPLFGENYAADGIQTAYS